MVATLDTREDLFFRRLQVALTMEHDSLASLAELREAGASTEVEKLLSHHADETRHQIENLHAVFRMLGADPAPAGSPASAGIRVESRELLAATGPDLRDDVVLAAALGNEHHEIGSYLALVMAAEGLGADEAAQRLQTNLAQEVHTSEELRHRLQAGARR